MDIIIESDQSRDTRMKWAIDYAHKLKCPRPSYFLSVTGWEYIIDQLIKDVQRDDIINLILQCRAVGLQRKANELEQSLGDISATELHFMYQESQQNL